MLVSHLMKIGAAAAIASFSCSLLIVISQKWHWKLSHDHDLDSVQKVHATAVPRIGGIAVIAGILFGLLILKLIYPAEIQNSIVISILILLGASMPAFIAGIIEDITKKVSVRVRLIATLSSALIASALLGATVDQLDIWGLDSLLRLAPIAILVTAIVVAGGANAINIIDGFNGLSVSVIVIMSTALGVVAWQTGDTFVTLLSALAIGGALGFFPLNYPTGKLFLGDGGAYFLGFWVSEVAVLLLVRNPEINAWQVLSICAYPVIEVLFSVYRRRFIRNGSAGDADALHLHTLVFRRVVRRLVANPLEITWLRNAMVVGVIVPCVAFLAVCSVLVGTTVWRAAGLVLAQIVIYIIVYARLVRSRWGSKGRPLAIEDHNEVVAGA